jgi:hypothetical protein
VKWKVGPCSRLLKLWVRLFTGGGAWTEIVLDQIDVTTQKQGQSEYPINPAWCTGGGPYVSACVFGKVFSSSGVECDIRTTSTLPFLPPGPSCASMNGCQGTHQPCTPGAIYPLTSWIVINGGPTKNLTPWKCAGAPGGVLYTVWRVVETVYNRTYAYGNVSQVATPDCPNGFQLIDLPPSWTPEYFTYPGYMRLELGCF